jgi:hypothetical protein
MSALATSLAGLTTDSLITIGTVIAEEAFTANKKVSDEPYVTLLHGVFDALARRKILPPRDAATPGIGVLLDRAARELGA